MLKKIASKLKPFSKKEKVTLHKTDLHSHLIPSIDDGTKSLEESIDIILQLQKLGFKKIITTPHIMSHRFKNTRKTVSYGYLELKNELARLDIDIDLQVAAEYYYDEYFLDLIDKDEILTFGDNYVLFELSYTVKPFMIEQTVDKLLRKGYKPVLAHPERYSYYSSEQDYRMLKEQGLFFQINTISMEGFYGKKVKKAVENIIDLGFVDFIGSDIHSQRYLDSFSNSIKSKMYSKLMSKNQIKNDYL